MTKTVKEMVTLETSTMVIRKIFKITLKKIKMKFFSKKNLLKKKLISLKLLI